MYFIKHDRLDFFRMGLEELFHQISFSIILFENKVSKEHEKEVD